MTPSTSSSAPPTRHVWSFQPESAILHCSTRPSTAASPAFLRLRTCIGQIMYVPLLLRAVSGQIDAGL